MSVGNIVKVLLDLDGSFCRHDDANDWNDGENALAVGRSNAITSVATEELCILGVKRALESND
jgi:hypothetical protein